MYVIITSVSLNTSNMYMYFLNMHDIIFVGNDIIMLLS